MSYRTTKSKGFTIVELLIVIVVIAILATISIVAFNGVQARARNAKIISDIKQVHKQIEAYKVINGEYPRTQATGTLVPASFSNPISIGYDSNCMYTAVADENWVPGLPITLPQSDTSRSGGAVDRGGCYLYVSDGTHYILSAWNMLHSPQTDVGYRRVGFREMPAGESTSTNSQFYLCNHPNIGGSPGGTYVSSLDFYKYSYTFSNITTCNETPPSGA